MKVLKSLPPPSRVANLAPMTITAAAMLGLGIWLILPLLGPDVANFATTVSQQLKSLFHLDITVPAVFSCDSAETLPPQLPMSMLFLAFGIGSFAAGNVLGQFRRGAHAEVPTSRLDQVMLTLLFLIVACALAYETFGTWLSGIESTDFQPITSFVRCATNHYPIQGLIVESASSFLAGQWLHRSGPA